MKVSSAHMIWFPAGTLVTMLLCLGCAQKGDLSPTESKQNTLSFLETVVVNPPTVTPGGTASVQALIVGEANEPASAEDVRFTVSRGAISIMHSDTTVQSDSLGYAHATFTAPSDTGSVTLRTELLRMVDVQFTTIHVVSAP